MLRNVLPVARRFPISFIFRPVVARNASTDASSKGEYDEPIELLPTEYLRAIDARNFDPKTFQRQNVAFDTENGKLLPENNSNSNCRIRSYRIEGDCYDVQWDDGLESKYEKRWIEKILQEWQRPQDSTSRTPWRNLNEKEVRDSSEMCLPFSLALESATGLKALYKYGFLLVPETPIDDDGEGVAALASAFSGGAVKTVPSASLLCNYLEGGTDIVLPHGTDGPLRTLYGTVWSTTTAGQADGASIADSAYGSGALPLHTDMTYLRDPPGLQIFTMVRPALNGGQSVIADGFAAAEYLKAVDPMSFELLSKVERRYRCIDSSTGWHLEARGPVISERNGSIIAIRHNDLDRLPDLPPHDLKSNERHEFYEKLVQAHRKWDEVLSMDDFRLVLSLKPGDTLVVANQVSFRIASKIM